MAIGFVKLGQPEWLSYLSTDANSGSPDAEMVRLGYKDTTMVWYRGCWRRLQKYFAARGAEEFSLEVAMAWVEEACGFFAKEQAGHRHQRPA
ncbi:hypothetical protein [Acrocarpospora sp. B8E8]|uniref:hypothetical protein n=1 Tax=Acrocarpospora sp. B8E8 TaxID=3153572 RepID=UPI00325C7504